MIRVRATVLGEPDVPPFTKTFDYGSADEEIFFSSASMVREKLARGMKINANEALTAYCAHVVKSIRASKSDSNIKDSASKILSVDKVMIGVPETLRTITFDAKLDGRPARKIVLRELIPASSYVMAAR